MACKTSRWGIKLLELPKQLLRNQSTFDALIYAYKKASTSSLILEIC